MCSDSGFRDPEPARMGAAGNPGRCRPADLIEVCVNSLEYLEYLVANQDMC